MPELTPETVAAALKAKRWAINLILADDGEFQKHVGVTPIEHFDTLAELSRQQHEAIVALRCRAVIGNVEDTRTLEALAKATAVLALWPDEGAGDTDE